MINSLFYKKSISYEFKTIRLRHTIDYYFTPPSPSQQRTQLRLLYLTGASRHELLEFFLR